MEYKPVEVIRQARSKAEFALQEQIAGEVQRICDEFAYDTGLSVESVCIDFVDVTTFGDVTPKSIISKIRVEYSGV